MSEVAPSSGVVRFAAFEVDLTNAEVRKHGFRIRLQDQPFRVLQILLEHPGELVTREELQRQIWPADTFVDFEKGLNNAVKRLRDALGDSAGQPRIIETYARRGYRFIAHIERLHGPNGDGARVNPVVPPRLEEVINKALEKDRNLRYQHASEVRADLQRLKRDTDSGRSAATGAVTAAQQGTVIDEQRGASGSQQAPVVDRGRPPWKILIPAAVVLLGLVAGGLYWRSQKPAKLTDKDTIVIADFTNTTGDVVFDDTLKEALSIGLRQSPFLSILSEQRVKEILEKMGRASDQRLDKKTARELCQRSRSAAVIEGSIANLGNEYILTLDAVNCGTGDSVAQEQVQVQRKEDVLKALGEALTNLRPKLGESLSTVQKYDVSLIEATTPSLDALKAYSLGVHAQGEGKDSAIEVQNLKRAIELDPNFATAYSSLGVAYAANLEEPGLAAQYLQKAFEMRDRVSALERLQIEAFYYALVTGELEKGLKVFRDWEQAYPRESQPHLNLGVITGYLGQYETEVKEEQEALLLSPSESGPAYANLMEGYIALGRLDEAKAIGKQGLDQKMEGQFLRDDLYDIAFLEGDTEAMKQQVQAVAGETGVEDLLQTDESDTAAYYGRLRKARELSQTAVKQALGAGGKEVAALWQLTSALREAEFGNAERARQEVKSGLAIASTRDVRTLAALTLACASDTKQAKDMADKLQKEFPLHTMLNHYWLPTVRGYIAIHEGRPANAIEFLNQASAYDLAFPLPQFSAGGTLYPPYVRGQAYLALKSGKDATGEFQKILDHRTMVANFHTLPLARLGLARAYASRADTAKAKAAYQDFLTLWKDADPDIPILIAAKSEYAKL